MPHHQKNKQDAKYSRERLRHPVILLVLLDLITLGLYSAVRCYPVHAGLSEHKGRRLFSPAFLHVLVVITSLLAILRLSRGSMPWDATVLMAQFGSALLMITLLLVFRQALHDEFKLRVRPLPLAIFGFWYLQYQINRGHEHAVRQQESWVVPATVAPLSIVIRMALITLPWSLL
ncbi:MAG TPA: hypothetical protein VFO10_28335 [Oligoflexus sp.]|uniref:hypothetical protein n=1 Tax=Oligoflexus sp. TaxID=1971216 RepID=UPI002D7FDBF1|nr:hypothetical protein [Oligoflexus sp.]HET9241206.1 hypothetical protein [Oligoflexus sp.]